MIVSCSGNIDICSKYLQKKYLEQNLKHQRIFEEGEIEKAIKIVEKIVATDSINYIAINYLGAYNYGLCQRTECSPEDLKIVYDLYKRSITLCEEYRIGYFNIIEVLTEMNTTKYGDDTEILTYFEIYNSKYEKNSNVLAKGGEALFRLGRIQESIKYLKESIKLDSTNAEAYIHLGKCHIFQNEWERALILLNRGLSIDSLSLGFHDRGYVNFKLDNIAEAKKDYRTAISLYRDRWESYVGFGQIEVNNNNFELACEYFNKAEKIIGENKTLNEWLEKYCQSE